jgi:hypothetical protein
MKKIVIRAFVFLLLACNPPVETDVDVISEENVISFNYHNLENGDIIIKRGKGFVSNMIVKYLKEDIPISHCGIIIVENESVYIIHSVAKEISARDGIQTASIDDFLNDSYKESLFIVRPHFHDSVIKANYLAKAKAYLQLKIPFDYDFNLEDESKIYCSELIYCCYDKDDRTEIFKTKLVNGQKVVLFNSFLNDRHFEIIDKY